MQSKTEDQGRVMKRILRIILGLVLLAGAVWGMCKFRIHVRQIGEVHSVEQKLNALPDHDYIAEIRQAYFPNGCVRQEWNSEKIKHEF